MHLHNVVLFLFYLSQEDDWKRSHRAILGITAEEAAKKFIHRSIFLVKEGNIPRRAVICWKHSSRGGGGVQ